MISTSMKKQQGAALAVGLILMLIFTLMGYTSMKGTMLQEKMAAGLHNYALAQSGANSAVRAGEIELYKLVGLTNAVDIKGTPQGELFNIYSQLEDPDDETSDLNPIVQTFKERNWVSQRGKDHPDDFSLASFNGALNKQPHYIIEQISDIAFGAENSQEFDNAAGSD